MTDLWPLQHTSFKKNAKHNLDTYDRVRFARQFSLVDESERSKWIQRNHDKLCEVFDVSAKSADKYLFVVVSVAAEIYEREAEYFEREVQARKLSVHPEWAPREITKEWVSLRSKYAMLELKYFVDAYKLDATKEEIHQWIGAEIDDIISMAKGVVAEARELLPEDGGDEIDCALNTWPRVKLTRYYRHTAKSEERWIDEHLQDCVVAFLKQREMINDDLYYECDEVAMKKKVTRIMRAASLEYSKNALEYKKIFDTYRIKLQHPSFVAYNELTRYNLFATVEDRVYIGLRLEKFGLTDTRSKFKEYIRRIVIRFLMRMLIQEDETDLLDYTKKSLIESFDSAPVLTPA